ncbi:MAG: hypothetical protein FD122_3784, partial [Stygiobacter sp.]
MKKLVILFVVLFNISFSQKSAGDESTVEPRYLIDIPTAGILKRGSVAFDGNFFQDGGVMFGIYVGALEKLTMGVSYGGVGIIGKSPASMQPLPGVMVKYRIIDESSAMPAIALGFDSQGKETYIDTLERFTIKSRGIFIVGSKNY